MSFFGLRKCELIKKIFVASSHNLSQNISKKYDIDAVTFSSKKGEQDCVLKVLQSKSEW